MKNGVFCISIDLELLWGRRNRKEMDLFIPLIKNENGLSGVVSSLLSLFKKYSIPATWAIVGKIFVKSNEKDSCLWSGTNLINLIQGNPFQEIACHSYTHPEFDQIPESQAEEELKKCVEIARKNNIKLSSFVYPRNKIKYLHLLKKYSFSCYRGDVINYLEFSNPFKDIFKIISMLIIPKTAKISYKEGLINIPGTMYFFSTRGLRRYTPYGIKYWKAKKSIDQAISRKKLFHLWFHPVDFAKNKDRQLKELEKILVYASQKQKLGLLEIKNMKQISDNINYFL